MKINKFFLAAGGLILLSIYACDREEEVSGCTDHLAENHDPRATIDDGSCTYALQPQVIWKDGIPGGWDGNLTTYGFIPTVCQGEFIAAPDTGGAPAPGMLKTDDEGNVNLQFRLTNPRTARDYIEGFVHFSVSKPDGSDISSFHVYIYGKEVDNIGNCGEYIRSERVELSAASLSAAAMTMVSVPFRDFDQLLLADIGIVFGIEVTGASPNTEVLQINDIRWTRF